jgi:hypothetical protein
LIIFFCEVTVLPKTTPAPTGGASDEEVRVERRSSGWLGVEVGLELVVVVEGDMKENDDAPPGAGAGAGAGVEDKSGEDDEGVMVEGESLLPPPVPTAPPPRNEKADDAPIDESTSPFVCTSSVTFVVGSDMKENDDEGPAEGTGEPTPTELPGSESFFTSFVVIPANIVNERGFQSRRDVGIVMRLQEIDQM